MRIIPLADALKMEDGEKVTAVCVKVDAIWDRKTGTNANGEWSLQNVTVQDPKNPKITMKVKFGNVDPIPKVWKGKQIMIACTKSDKHGLVGVVVKDDSYTDKSGNEVNQKILSVTKAAEYGPAEQLGTGGGSQASEPENGGGDDQPAGDGDDTPPPAPAKKDPPPNQAGRGFPAIKALAKEKANLYLIALEAVGYVSECNKIKTGKELTLEQQQTATASIYISLERSGGADVVPTTDFREVFTKAKQAEEEARRQKAAQDEDVPM